MISVKQSYNPSHLPCRIRLLAHRNDCRCDYTTCLAATKRSECAFHLCDFECPVSTNRHLGSRTLWWLRKDSKAFKKSALSSSLPRMQRPSPWTTTTSSVTKEATRPASALVTAANQASRRAVISRVAEFSGITVSGNARPLCYPPHPISVSSLPPGCR
jgi:hypothetical protein